jgi:outer membrane protein OmpA-like peptidoglycan-associated protein
MGSLGIAIEGGRYVRVDSSLGDLYRTVRLRTLHAGQDTAKLDFCVFGKKGPSIRKTVVLKGLAGDDKPSELRLRVERRSFAVWNINVRKPGGSSEEFQVRTGIGLWPVLLLSAALLILIAWLVFGILTKGAPDHAPPVPSAATVTTTSSEETSESKTFDAQSAEPLVEENIADETVSVFPEQTILYFLPESAALTRQTLSELDILAGIVPESIHLEIGGHCAIFGTERGRVLLSRARANAVADYLSHQIPSSVSIEVRGYGGSRPLNREFEFQDKNRRVEINVIRGDE